MNDLLVFLIIDYPVITSAVLHFETEHTSLIEFSEQNELSQLRFFHLSALFLPLQLHLAVGSGAQQHGDALLRSHRRQLRPGVPLSVRRLADHRLLLQPGGGGDAPLPVVPSHDGPPHGVEFSL